MESPGGELTDFAFLPDFPQTLLSEHSSEGLRFGIADAAHSF